ncbi:MAG: type II toxin-antitoxin system VapC family toxin [Mariprofundaceae bacterium]|nr:type II toxin-antitoxin system VapC family toxin [Mariprofundaceae bacterium]
MSYLLDTNVLSELVRPKPSPAVLAWFENTPDDSLYISVLTIGEIRKGVETVVSSARKEKLRVWLEHTLPDWFQNRVLSIDEPVAERWGRLLAEAHRPLPAIDSLLAATALHYDLRVVTRNVQDFTFPELEVINPWA